MAMGWQWGQGPWKHFYIYIQVSDVLCYKPIPISLNDVETSLLSLLEIFKCICDLAGNSLLILIVMKTWYYYSLWYKSTRMLTECFNTTT